VIFVFGSNLKGIHGAGAAAFAHKYRGAVWEQGEGLQGDSYALPTCSEPGEPLDLRSIEHYISRFLNFAKEHPLLEFQVTAIGCGLAGYKPGQIAPLFFKHGTVENVWLPSRFFRAIYWIGYDQHSRDFASDS